MSGKASRPCIACGRHMKTHRGKRLVCSQTCRELVKIAQRQGRKRKDPMGDVMKIHRL